ncbi:MAG TPA: toll/interleukin-1 receptor domain-containing protein [Chitinophagaceae bacterium]|jgi:hypothetical protein
MKQKLAVKSPGLKVIKREYRRLKYKFDFFISYATEDAYEIIVPLAREMKKFSITYFLDLEQIHCGESLSDKLSFGITRSKYTLAIITQKSIKKPWVRAELHTVLHRQISSGQTKLLPVISGTSRQVSRILEIMPLLRDLHYIKWHNNPHEVAGELRKILDKKHS